MIRPRGDSEALPSEAEVDEVIPVEEDQRIILHGVSWDQYRAVRAALDHLHGVRMTYVEGALEIMSPGRRHEEVSKLIARLVEIYALEEAIDLDGFGSMTFRRKAEERGAEPDQCYSIGRMKRFPHIAIEVVVTSDVLDKLDIYRRFRIPEVWLWKDGRFSIHVLRPRRGYELVARSELLPGLDFRVVESLIASGGSQTEIVRTFRDRIRGKRK